MGGRVIRERGLFHFLPQKGEGLIREGAYLRGGPSREIRVCLVCFAD